MNTIEIILISISLASDAFSVALGKGIVTNKLKLKNIIIVGAYFGIFQALMPYLGFNLTSIFGKYLMFIDHFIAFFILSIIGANMFFDKKDAENDDYSYKIMLPLAIGTSIDAFSVGITLTFMNIDIFSSVLIIGLITFLLSVLGVIIGFKLRNNLKVKPQKIGGLLLIIMGLKILIEHLFF